MKITAINKFTGEVIELPADKPEDFVAIWRTAQELEKVSKSLKLQAKKLIPDLVGPNGLSEPIIGHQFRISTIQRMSYDKRVMREVLDEDTFDLFLIPDKVAVDNYLKENLEKLPPEVGNRLRQEMIPIGNPYQTIKLEKL